MGSGEWGELGSQLNGYQERRRQRRTVIKAALLRILQEAAAGGQRVDLAGLAIRFRCGVSTLRSMKHELGAEGLIEPPEGKQLRLLSETAAADLAGRIAAVRAAKIERHRNLTEDELDEVLPDAKPT